jgi:hypothetical protein
MEEQAVSRDVDARDQPNRGAVRSIVILIAVIVLTLGATAGVLMLSAFG